MKIFYPVFFAILLTILVWSCTSDTVTTNTSTAYDNADFTLGGIMYDKFWSAAGGFNQADTNIANFNAFSNFFRCKQCHAWDYLGQGGSYIGRAPNTSRPRVANLNLYVWVQSKTPQEIFDALKTSVGRRDISYDLGTYDPNTNFTEGDKMPNLGQLLTDSQIWNITKYLKAAIFDVSQLYDAVYSGTYPTGSASFSNVGRDGNSTSGGTYYSTECSSCHGPTGITITIEGNTLGGYTRTKPYEVQQKVKYGHPDSPMPGDFDVTLSQMKDLFKALSDTTAFPN